MIVTLYKLFDTNIGEDMKNIKETVNTKELIEYVASSSWRHGIINCLGKTPVRLSELSDSLGIESSNVWRALDQLMKKGLVEGSEEVGKRGKIYSLTELGIQVAESRILTHSKGGRLSKKIENLLDKNRIQYIKNVEFGSLYPVSFDMVIVKNFNPIIGIKIEKVYGLKGLVLYQNIILQDILNGIRKDILLPLAFLKKESGECKNIKFVLVVERCTRDGYGAEQISALKNEEYLSDMFFEDELDKLVEYIKGETNAT